MKLTFEYNRDELNALAFPIIVEMWDKVVRPGSSGSKRRKYHEEFTEKERKIISWYHTKFYRWYLVKGTPAYHIFRKASTITLLERAVQFFAGI